VAEDQDRAIGDCCLTGAPRAEIGVRKLLGYALNPAHERGGGKARVFATALGFGLSNYEGLLDQLRRGAMAARARPGRVDEFGARYIVDIPVVGPRGRAVVRTAWIYYPGSLVPRLITLYVL
jgi:filamentous hemagglutinin